MKPTIYIFAIAMVASNLAFADGTITTTCTRGNTSWTSGFGNPYYSCTTSYSTPPAPSPEPFVRGPITSEEIYYVVPKKTKQPTQPPRSDNFCGAGYKMTADGRASK